MVPAAFVWLERLPLTPNGKLDTRALPTPEITSERLYRAPVSHAEVLIASLYSELTGVARVGLDDSFFTLGGDSITAIRLVSRARAHLLQFTVRTVFEHPSVASLAAQAQRLDKVSTIARAAPGALALTPVQAMFLQLPGSISRFDCTPRCSAPAINSERLRTRTLATRPGTCVAH